MDIRSGKPSLLPAHILQRRELALLYQAVQCRLADAEQFHCLAEAETLVAPDQQIIFVKGIEGQRGLYWTRSTAALRPADAAWAAERARQWLAARATA